MSLARTPRPRPTRQTRHAFTLIELIVVIGILAILVSLVLAGIGRGTVTVNNAAVSQEVNKLAQAMETFKSEHGGKYPPSWLVVSEKGGEWDSAAQKKSLALLKSIFGSQFSGDIDRDFDGDGTIAAGMDARQYSGDECLVLFLGGLPKSDDPKDGLEGLSKNPADPFARGGSSRTRYFEFNAGQLIDPDNDSLPAYKDGLASQTRPYLYLSAYSGTGYKTTPDSNLNGSPRMASAYESAPGTFWNANSFQIISPGADANYGPGGVYEKTSATTTLIGARKAESDNITNFSTGTLAD